MVIFDLDSGADDTFRDAAAPPPTSTQPQVSAAANTSIRTL